MPFEKFEDAEAIDNERNSGNLVKKSLIRPIDRGGKRSFH